MLSSRRALARCLAGAAVSTAPWLAPDGALAAEVRRTDARKGRTL